MFEKTLTDLIKGIRANPSGEPEFIATCIAECRQELLSVEPSVKQMAVLKLTYLQMLGHDVAWAAFHCVDVMSSPRFRAKRIGFLGAAQTFNESTDVLLLTTNLFRKAFASSTQHEASIAVGCLARIATPDLARDLMGDVTNMLGSSRPLLRKKAVLALYRLLQRLPEALVPAFPRLRERLDDPDPSVVACTVNVLTELATDNPKGYLGLAPALYKVLTTSSSNWTLIKVVKFLRQLVPHEPRLAKKLVQPLTHLIDSTPAKSLQFECLYTVATTMASSQPELAALAAAKLKEFVESTDPNLKSLGLLALAALQTSDKGLVEPCRDAVLRCLDGEPSVRAAALALIAGMVTRASLVELVHKLLGQIEGAATAYRDDVVAVILSSVRADGFAHVPSFRWLVTTLFTVAALESKHGVEVARLAFEVTLRVPTVRTFAAEVSLERVLKLQSAAAGPSATGAPSLSEPPADAALLAASYVLGEHAALLPAPMQSSALQALLSPSILCLEADVQASCVQAAVRVLVHGPTVAAVVSSAATSNGNGDGAAGAAGELIALLDSLRTSLLVFCTSVHPEVAERARGAHAIVNLVGSSAAGSARELMHALREGMAPELKAVAPKAQRKVKPPPDLDLHTPIYSPTPADWAALRGTVPAPAIDGSGESKARTSGASAPPATESADPTVPAERPAPRPRPGAVGPYYLPAEPRAPTAPAEEPATWQPTSGPTPTGDTAAGGGAASGGSFGSGGVVSGGGSCYGDEHENATVVDLHEDMPDDAEQSDDEKAAEAPAGATRTAAAQGTSELPASGGPTLAPDVTTAAAPAPREAGEDGGRRRRRRKHRSGGGDEECGDPLVSLT